MKLIGPLVIVLIGLGGVFVGVFTFASPVETEPMIVAANALRPGFSPPAAWLRVKGVRLREDLLFQRNEGNRRRRIQAYLPVFDAASEEWTGLVLSVQERDLAEATGTSEISGVISAGRLPAEVGGMLEARGLPAAEALAFRYGGQPLQRGEAAFIGVGGLFTAVLGGLWFRKIRAASVAMSR